MVVVGWVGVVASYPFLIQASTPVEVELGCDKKQNNQETDPSKRESWNIFVDFPAKITLSVSFFTTLCNPESRGRMLMLVFK